jgi:hypothetical protein
LCDNEKWSSSFVLKRRRPTSDATPFTVLGLWPWAGADV